MSGHSKWSTIKHKKGKTDAQRGKLFSKLVKEITSAAKSGGGDQDSNPRLRLAIDKAKESNMPSDNIDRAIAKGTGGGEGITIEEITYEGYGPAGVAILVECMTDNKQRTVAEIRHLFTRGGGNMGESGCVGWMFKKKGIMTFEKDKIDEDKLGMDAIEAGAEDINLEKSVLEVLTNPEDFIKVRDALKAKGFVPESSEISMFPQSTIKLIGEDARKVMSLVDSFEEHDDVQNVHANFDIPDEILEQES
ncbi:MAG: YebC/PmpR family DNA-binding transcriptional regulator [Candidatus Margulisiibacteriota bacterium]|nr:YebC/PmpR family DNA-binding transcriptional regulator [Candidatus Margulisiibacteriota bacterium]